MNRRLNRVLDEIQKTERRIAEWQSRLKDLHAQRKLMEDAEILKSIRSTKLEGRELIEFLEKLQEDSQMLRPDTGDAVKDISDDGKNRANAPDDRAQEREDVNDEKNA